MGRVGLHDVTCHQPIKEHADSGQVLFDSRPRVHAVELLDIRRDVHRRHPARSLRPFSSHQAANPVMALK